MVSTLRAAYHRWIDACQEHTAAEHRAYPFNAGPTAAVMLRAATPHPCEDTPCPRPHR